MLDVDTNVISIAHSTTVRVVKGKNTLCEGPSLWRKQLVALIGERRCETEKKGGYLLFRRASAHKGRSSRSSSYKGIYIYWVNRLRVCIGSTIQY